MVSTGSSIGSSPIRRTRATATPRPISTRIPWTFPEAIELWQHSEIAVECFGEEVHHHVLVHAEAEWLAFNQTVTDWERARYFERI